MESYTVTLAFFPLTLCHVFKVHPYWISESFITLYGWVMFHGIDPWFDFICCFYFGADMNNALMKSGVQAFVWVWFHSCWCVPRRTAGPTMSLPWITGGTAGLSSRVLCPFTFPQAEWGCLRILLSINTIIFIASPGMGISTCILQMKASRGHRRWGLKLRYTPWAWPCPYPKPESGAGRVDSGLWEAPGQWADRRSLALSTLLGRKAQRCQSHFWFCMGESQSQVLTN